jgi:hypothetical protein
MKSFGTLVPATLMLLAGLSRSQVPPVSPSRPARTGDVADLRNEPVAYIGHGAIFDRNGKEIRVTPKFARDAEQFYVSALLKIADEKTRSEYALITKDFASTTKSLDTRGKLFVESAMAEKAIGDVRPTEAAEIYGKIALLKQSTLAEFKPPSAVAELMLKAGLPAANLTMFSTVPATPDYVSQCSEAGVPVPPDWGDPRWVSQGTLAGNQVFISQNATAEVFTYQSIDPEGMCVALPRSKGDTISLLGIICLSKVKSNACFWDNQQDKVNYPIQKGAVVPLTQFAGGPALDGGTGGVCTECHAGENPYIIHPGTNLGPPKLAALPLMGNGWYKPLVDPSWPQNPGPTNILASVISTGKCTVCHARPGPGGRFPEVSQLKGKGYCATVLPSAIKRTMPPGSPNNPSYAPQANALLAACNQP